MAWRRTWVALAVALFVVAHLPAQVFPTAAAPSALAADVAPPEGLAGVPSDVSYQSPPGETAPASLKTEQLLPVPASVFTGTSLDLAHDTQLAQLAGLAPGQQAAAVDASGTVRPVPVDANPTVPQAVVAASADKPATTAAVPIEVVEDAAAALEVQTVNVQHSDLFEQLDVDQDHFVNSRELRRFIRGIGTTEFDETSEIRAAASAAMGKAQLHDEASDNLEDKYLSMRDIQIWWEQLGAYMPVEEVLEWLSHAVGLPQYRQVFEQNRVTGYDFAALLENNGQSLAEDLGIANRFHRAQIMRAIQMRLLSVAAVPTTPSEPLYNAVSCDSVQLKWLHSPDTGVAVHKYTLERRTTPDGPWEIVYHGPGVYFADQGLDPTRSYDYRLRAWNAIGHSEYTMVRGCRTQTTGCGGGSAPISFSLSSIGDAIRNLATFLTLVVLAWRARTYMRVGGLASFLGPPAGRGGYSHSGTNLLRTTRGLVSDGVTPGTPPSIDTLDLNDGTGDVSTADAQRTAADSTPVTSDQSRCNVCHKPFSTIKGRRRHHCFMCGQKFCSKHGYTPHAPLTACSVPSTCMCQKCMHRR